MRARDRRLIGISAILTGLVAAAHLLRLPALVVDDAFISYRYADHLAHGQGLVFNAGEHVEGFSNPLWVFLTAAGMTLGLDPVTLTRTAGAISIIGAIMVTIVLTWRLSRSHPAAFVAGLLLAASTAFCAAAMSGLETGLFAFLVALGTLLFIEGQPVAASCAWGLAAITRPEGAAIWLLAMLCLAITRPRRPWDYWLRLILPAAALIGGLLSFRHWYFGAWLPNSVVAKSAMLPALARAPLAGWPALLFNEEGLTYIGRFALSSVGLLAPLALVALFVARGRRRIAVILAAQLLLGCGIALYNFGDWMTAFRLLTPYQPALVALVCSAAALLARRIPMRDRSALRRSDSHAWQTLALGGVALVGVSATWQRQMPSAADQPDPQIAAVLEHSRQSDLLIATDVLGRISYYAPHVRVLDMAGLADPYIARHGEPKHSLGKWDLSYVLGQHPHMLLTNVLNAWGRTPSDPAFNAEYVWMDEPTWRPTAVLYVGQRYIFIRRGCTLEQELRAAYPTARWRDPTSAFVPPHEVAPPANNRCDLDAPAAIPAPRNLG